MKNQKRLLNELVLLESTILLALIVIDNLSSKKMVIKELKKDYLNDLKRALKDAEHNEDFETCIDLKNKIDQIENNGITSTAN